MVRLRTPVRQSGVPSASEVVGPDGCFVPMSDTGWVRLTEFWRRMDQHLGATYARTWARDHVLADLGERTVMQALDAGWDVKDVWRAVWRALELPPSER
jgi:hypothetical protein